MLIDPDERGLRHYRKRQQQDREYYAGLIRLKEAPAKTLDKVLIRLQANVELPQDFEIVRQVGASGIGLYRTEFLYMNREGPPEEEEHYETYLSALGAVEGLPLTIRTVDLGADKQVDGGRQGGVNQAKSSLGIACSAIVPEGAGLIPTAIARDPAGLRPRQDPFDDPDAFQHTGNPASPADD